MELSGSYTPRSVLNPLPARILLFVARRRYLRMLRAVCLVLGGDIGPQDYVDVQFPHPYGITIHASSKIGAGCVIYQNVTIGSRDGSGGCPTLGADVYVGANAVILGPVMIGSGARVGAGAVVIADVPPGASAVGNPARIIVRR